MFVNGKSLLKAAPIKDMALSKMTYKGTSYGLAEAGYDIRIKQSIAFYPNAKNIVIQHKLQDPVETLRNTNFTIASAIEEFQMPNNLVGQVTDKSSWARKGLSVFNTVIEPGWNGFLTLELVYHGSEPLFIEAGQGIAQVLFGCLVEPGDYGNGKYQNQEDKPVKSRK